MKSDHVEMGALDSKARDEDWVWRSNIPYGGRIRVSKEGEPFHEIYFQLFGNPKGAVVIVVHGGPGGGCQTEYAQIFDPEHYCIVLFDQRGCGFSVPTVHSDPEAGLAANT